ncbi:MAG: TIGR01212 family radical SAM protein [Clostridia bacterium]|nr:TIGR01212 family radical SAM protein [Clostridia bacterium]
MSQVNNNPFKYSDTNKRYHTYDYYLKKRFGEKCAKIPLDAGATCPNIDGRCGTGGCIYCLGGSGARLASELLTVREQYIKGKEKLSSKWNTEKCIPYLQAYTNTYTSPFVLRQILNEVSSFEGAVMIDIATRADCLDDGIIRVIDEMSRIIPITVELGLQSSNDETAKIINRGHDFDTFKEGFYRLRQGAPNVKIGIHIINGLPGETAEEMKNTARSVANLHPDLVKIHLLHVLDGTRLGQMYKAGEYTPMDRDEYIRVVCDQIELLPADIVIERVTGDGIATELLAPEWSKKKVAVINDIDKELFRRNTYQGKRQVN